MKNKKTLLLIVLLAVIAVTIYILASKEILVVRPGPASVKMDELTLHTSEFPSLLMLMSITPSMLPRSLTWSCLPDGSGRQDPGISAADRGVLEYFPTKGDYGKINPAAEWSDGPQSLRRM